MADKGWQREFDDPIEAPDGEGEMSGMSEDREPAANILTQIIARYRLSLEFERKGRLHALLEAVKAVWRLANWIRDDPKSRVPDLRVEFEWRI